MRDGNGVDQWGSPLKPALLESDSTVMHSHSSSNSYNMSNGNSSSNNNAIVGGVVPSDLNRSVFSAFDEPSTAQGGAPRLPDAAFKV